uniref:Uncharacterized protein n=1 Tax=Arundo donax TaxID=35708 RepID=A0A0A9DDM4_ARUDO
MMLTRDHIYRECCGRSIAAVYWFFSQATGLSACCTVLLCDSSHCLMG